MRPLVAIVGRPNVGKSTLLNRLSGRKVAVVSDTPGVTRDHLFAEIELGGRPVLLADTAGFDPAPRDDLTRATLEQAKTAIRQADFILFVCDARDGLHPVDQTIADALRRSGKPVLCLVNKSDPGAQGREPWEFHRLGIELLPVSASHGTGLDAMAHAVAAGLPARAAEEPVVGAGDELRICLLGRPNVGKSSLCNALAGEARQLVSETPGTTRDAVDVTLIHGGVPVRLVDTPGVRRKRSIKPGLERLSVVAALRSLERADVAVVVLDGNQAFSDQDARLLNLVDERGRGLVVAVNKTDLWQKGEAGKRLAAFAHGMRFVSYAPVLPVSALTGAGVRKLLPSAGRVHASTRERIPTGALNRFLEEVTSSLQPPFVKGKRARFYYITQPSVAPPTFITWVNDPTRIPHNYRRFLDNRLRQRFGFEGSPLRWVFKRRQS